MATAAAQSSQTEPLVRSGLGALLMVASAAVASTLGLSVRLVDDASGWLRARRERREGRGEGGVSAPAEK